MIYIFSNFSVAVKQNLSKKKNENIVNNVLLARYIQCCYLHTNKQFNEKHAKSKYLAIMKIMLCRSKVTFLKIEIMCIRMYVKLNQNDLLSENGH